MPNHITNRLTISCDDVQIKKDAYLFCFNQFGLFDFNKIVKMPDSVKDVVSISIFGEIAKVMNDPKKSKELKELLKRGRECICEGDTDAERDEYMLKQSAMWAFNLENYGAPTWYEWCNKHWGTKWNAYSQELPFENSNVEDFNEDQHKENKFAVSYFEQLFSTDPDAEPEIAFDTAWSTPYPVFVKLSEKFPEISVNVRYADEDIGHNCGEFVLKNGEVTHENQADHHADDEERRFWVEFACQVKSPGSTPEYWSRDENWNYVEEDDELEDS